MTALAGSAESNDDVTPGGDGEPSEPRDNLWNLLNDANVFDDDVRKAISASVKNRNVSDFSVIQSVDQLSAALASSVPQQITRMKVSDDFFKVLVANGIVTPPPTYVPASERLVLSVKNRIDRRRPPCFPPGLGRGPLLNSAAVVVDPRETPGLCRPRLSSAL